jgi:hypothetical protein
LNTDFRRLLSDRFESPSAGAAAAPPRPMRQETEQPIEVPSQRDWP